MQLGKVGTKLFQKPGTLVPLAGQNMYVLHFFIASIIWGLTRMVLFRCRVHQSI